MTTTEKILAILTAATQTAALAARALEAAKNGRQEDAEAYLKQSRAHFDLSRAAWEEAGVE